MAGYAEICCGGLVFEFLFVLGFLSSVLTGILAAGGLQQRRRSRQVRPQAIVNGENSFPVSEQVLRPGGGITEPARNNG
jgi:hypothetical protein